MLWKTINITIQVSVIGLVIGAIVSLCSIGFVFGVQKASHFRTEFDSCIISLNGSCFTISPLIFLLIAATLIIVVKKYLNIASTMGQMSY